MKRLRASILQNSGAFVGAVLLLAGCSPKETPPTVAATNNPPAPTAPILAPATNSQSSNPVAADIVLTPEEAKQHVGEIATVRGKVFGVSVSQKGDVFISIGAKRPAPFTAVCFKQAIPTDQLKALDGQTISVRGKIKDYNGQVETILEREEQILK